MRNLTTCLFRWLQKNEVWVLSSVLIIAALSHGFNMFAYPYFENDEGTYVSQAWWVVKYHQLSPYTYRYDHAPLGWIIIGIWQTLTGGPFTFGFSINSGRILMLLFHLASALFIFKITRQLVSNIWVAVFAVLIFSLSPLGIYFQRRVLLDNMMTSFLLASIYLLIKDGRNLFTVSFSALLFGLALLIKETAVFLFPGMVFLVNVNCAKENRNFSLISWITVVSMISSLYLLFAALKTELLPANWLLTLNRDPHVSLVDAISYQLNRGPNHSPLVGWQEFVDTFFDWLRKDPFIIIGGLLSMVVNLATSHKRKNILAISLLSLSFFLFLLSGKLIINFYIIPLLALFSISIPVAIYFLLRNQQKFFQAKGLIAAEILVFGVLAGFFFFRNVDAYYVDETSRQKLAVEWVKSHLSPNANIIVDNYAFLDLRESRAKDDYRFPNTDFFWNFQYDPQIKDIKYGGDWRNLDYIMLSHEMVVQMEGGSQELLLSAFDQSKLVRAWQPNQGTYLNLERLISTNGDWVRVYKVKRSQKDFADFLSTGSKLSQNSQ